MDSNILDEGFLDPTPIDNSKFVVYRSYHAIEEAEIFCKVLTKYDIPFKVEKSKMLMDDIFVGANVSPAILVRVHPSSFAEIKAVLEQEIRYSKTNYADDYLNELNEEELMEVLHKPEEWSVEDVCIAKILLEQRGIKFTEAEVAKIRKERISDLREGKDASKAKILLFFLLGILGWLMSIFFSFGGIAMLYYYNNYKEVDPNGYKYYAFKKNTRNFSQQFFLIGIVLLCVQLAILFSLGLGSSFFKAFPAF